MKIKQLSPNIKIEELLKKIDVDRGGISILSAKHYQYLILIEALHVGGANILKQDAISVGADLGVPKGTVVAKDPYVDAVLIGSKRSLQKLALKLRLQPFGLKEVGKYIEKTLDIKEKKLQIMGIINANDDSFYSKSRFKGKEALITIEKMIEDGANIIDIGGVSSRPGAQKVDPQEELERIKPIADVIFEEKLYEKVRFSIDSYSPEVISYVLERGFSIVNDITGFENDELCRLCAQYNAGAVIMHMQGTPQNMQKNPHYEDVICEVFDYLQQQAEKAESFGVKEVILDVGIGFGKTLQHNILLLQHLQHFQTLGYPLLIGASRKSMIDMIFKSDVSQRLAGTLSIHLKAIQEGADILRVHDVFEHKQAIEVWKALEQQG
ncbi:MAG: dihydropteroate synthase [Epsilonproteobacteria bacterium]|nr:dihydropteroate synthase [Campylobacterota bacterium]